MSEPISSSIRFDSTLGVTVVGAVVSAALYGIGTSQVFIFFQSFPYESVSIKALVGLVWGLDGLNAILFYHSVYTSAITNFGSSQAKIPIPWSYWLGMLTSVLSDTIVRLFFVYRIWKLSRKNILLCLPLLSLTVLILGSYLTLLSLGLMKIDSVLAIHKYSRNIYLTFSLVVAGDVAFTCCLTYYLRKGRRSLPRETVSVVNSLFVYSINTGAVASVLSVLTIVTYAKSPNTLWYLVFITPMGKLYANALFSTLNVRSWDHAGIDDARVPMMMINGNPTIPVAFADAPPPEMEIQVSTEVLKDALVHG